MTFIQIDLWDSAKINGPKLKKLAEGSDKGDLLKGKLKISAA